MSSGLKIIFYTDTERLIGKIPEMTYGSSNLVVLTKISLYCLCFCRRLNNYKILTHVYLSPLSLIQHLTID